MTELGYFVDDRLCLLKPAIHVQCFPTIDPPLKQLKIGQQCERIVPLSKRPSRHYVRYLSRKGLKSSRAKRSLDSVKTNANGNSKEWCLSRPRKRFFDMYATLKGLLLIMLKRTSLVEKSSRKQLLKGPYKRS
ncbi:hypothetical protein Trydic_g3050 [Trypoxylus dichotomus]